MSLNLEHISQIVDKASIGAGNQNYVVDAIDSYTYDDLLKFKNNGTGVFTISFPSGETIDEAVDFTLENDNDFIVIQRDPENDNNWSIVGQSGGGGNGLYLGETTISDLLNIPFDNLDEAYSYYIDGAIYVWDIDAIDGDFEPSDKINPGVDSGYWVMVSGGGLTELKVVEIDSSSTTSYSVDINDSPILIEVDTTDAPVSINLPQIVDNSVKVFIKNIGINDITVNSFSGDTVKTLTSFNILEGNYYQFTSDLDTKNWFDYMREMNVTAIQDYFFGFYVVQGEPLLENNGGLFLDVINMSSGQTIDYLKYNATYIIEDGGLAVTHVVSGSPIINTVSTPGIQVTL